MAANENADGVTRRGIYPQRSIIIRMNLYISVYVVSSNIVVMVILVVNSGYAYSNSSKS
jgi:hypothetical protein